MDQCALEDKETIREPADPVLRSGPRRLRNSIIAGIRKSVHFEASWPVTRTVLNLIFTVCFANLIRSELLLRDYTFDEPKE
jgi:hypothetical protein